MKFGMFYEVQVPRPAPPEAEQQRLREIIEQVVAATIAATAKARGTKTPR